ncbi:MAG: hypothetical protein ABJ370_17445 [Paracoccaceae bacterium]
MIDPDLTIEDRISEMIAAEISDYATDTHQALKNLIAFEAALKTPREVAVVFSGGVTQRCWQVTRSDGEYSVVYMPRAGYFSLCVDSVLGPLDIGVHGPALGCFGSV